IFATDPVAEPAKEQRAEWPHEEARTECSETGQKGRSLISTGKEERTEGSRQGGVDIEVVPFE
ncbi:hypothetical protein QMN58_31110, partial [Escherichia coli]|nr:hypothetical protein [Escherichia coli]